MASVVIQEKGGQNVYPVGDAKPYIQLMHCIPLVEGGVYDRAIITIGGLTVTVEKK